MGSRRQDGCSFKGAFLIDPLFCAFLTYAKNFRKPFGSSPFLNVAMKASIFRIRTDPFGTAGASPGVSRPPRFQRSGWRFVNQNIMADKLGGIYLTAIVFLVVPSGYSKIFLCVVSIPSARLKSEFSTIPSTRSLLCFMDWKKAGYRIFQRFRVRSFISKTMAICTSVNPINASWAAFRG